MRDDAQLVVATRSGDRDAFGVLVQRWFDRCWEVAFRILHDRDLAADVAQEAMMTAWQQLDRLEKPASFGGWILRIARNRALDRLARERRARPGDDRELEVRRDQPPLADPELEHARHERHDLVWAAAAALGERDSSLLDLHLRHGLEPYEIADELGIAPNAAHQALFRLRKRLAAAIRAWLLWSAVTRQSSAGAGVRGAATCPSLREALHTAGIGEFDPAAVKIIDRHVTSCEPCAEQQKRVTAPVAMFSAAPLVAIPVALREQTLSRLLESGIPVAAESHPDLANLDHPSADAASSVHPVSPLPDPFSAKSAVRRGWLQATAALLTAAAALVVWMWQAEPATEPAAADNPGFPAPQPFPDAPVEEPERGPIDTDSPPSDDDPTFEEPPDPPPPPSPPSAPQIRLFELDTDTDRPCGSGSVEHLLAWDVIDADHVTLTPPAAEPQPVAATGRLRLCAGWDRTFVLTATGTGGTSASSQRTPAAPEPEIVEFTVQNRGPVAACQPPPGETDATADDENPSDPSGRIRTVPSPPDDPPFLYELTWTTRYAHTAELTLDNDRPETVDTTAHAQRCVPNGTTFALEVIGEGGTATATRVDTLQPH